MAPGEDEFDTPALEEQPLGSMNTPHKLHFKPRHVQRTYCEVSPELGTGAD